MAPAIYFHILHVASVLVKSQPIFFIKDLQTYPIARNVMKFCLQINNLNFSTVFSYLSFSTKYSLLFKDAREAPEFLKTINEIIEERARQRFLEHWQRLQLNRNILQRTESVGPAFTYQSSPPKHPANPNDPIDFAVGPSDSRFYDRTVNIDTDNAYASNNLGSDQMSEHELIMNQNPNRNLPPSPQDIKPKLPIHFNQQSLDNKLRHREQIFDENLLPQRVNGVIQRPVEMDGAVAMYIVALIGGISAAVTVGLISVGIGWYT